MQLVRPGAVQSQIVCARRGVQRQGVLRRRSACSGRGALRIQAVAEAERTATKTSTSMTPVEKELGAKLRYQLGRTPKDGYSENDIYQGTAWSVREHLIDSFENTHDYWE